VARKYILPEKLQQNVQFIESVPFGPLKFFIFTLLKNRENITE